MLAIRDEGRLISIFSHDDGIILGGLLENFEETTRKEEIGRVSQWIRE
jgi:hypothetical protein